MSKFIRFVRDTRVAIIHGDTEHLIHPIDLAAVLTLIAIGAAWLCVQSARGYVNMAHTIMALF